MNIRLEPGRYVIAVSGGVDSAVLLHLLKKQPDVQLTVAHFDHGIRADSSDDQHFVRQLARAYRLPYVYSKGNLGTGASEAVARQARYNFLRATQLAAGAQAIVTAHHQDDVLETAIFNILRGTSRHGLTSLQSTVAIKRPLLHIPKVDIVRYARDNRLLWREDRTNASNIYRRNYIRHNLLSQFDLNNRRLFADIITNLREKNEEIDRLVAVLLTELSTEEGLQRRLFIMLPHSIAREVIATWLRTGCIHDIDSQMLERAVHAGKTYAAGQRVHVGRGWALVVQKNYLALEHIER